MGITKTSSLTTRALKNTANELIDTRLHMGGTVQFTIPTWSMFPTLSPGDQVIVRRVHADDMRLGEIVLLQAGGVWLAHRLIGRHSANGSPLLITKGDNCVQPDLPWQAAQLSGIVTAVQYNGREVSLVSPRARLISTLLARLSRAQLFLTHVHPGLARRVVLKASRLLFYVGVSLVRGMV